jgi:hypothetical protein
MGAERASNDVRHQRAWVEDRYKGGNAWWYAGTGKTTILREFRREHSIREIAVIDQRETLGHFRPCCGQWLLLYSEGATSKACALHGPPLAARATRKSPRSMQPCLMAAAEVPSHRSILSTAHSKRDGRPALRSRARSDGGRMLRQARLSIHVEDQAALTWVSGHRIFVATGEPHLCLQGCAARVREVATTPREQ